MTTWDEFTSTLPTKERKALMNAITALLQEVTDASLIAADGGDLDTARDHLLAAGRSWRDAGRILFGRPGSINRQ